MAHAFEDVINDVQKLTVGPLGLGVAGGFLGCCVWRLQVSVQCGAYKNLAPRVRAWGMPVTPRKDAIPGHGGLIRV